MIQRLYNKMESLTHRIIEAVSKAKTTDSEILTCMEQIAAALLAKHCYVFEIDQKVVRTSHEWVAHGIHPKKYNLGDISLTPEKQEDLYRRFQSGTPIAIANIDSLKETAADLYQRLKVNTVTSVIFCPLIAHDQLLGFFEVDNPAVASVNAIAPMMDIPSSFIASALSKNRLEQLTYYDYLTGCGNRRALYRSLETIDTSKSIGLVFCDIIGLKRKNDQEGHEAGDQLILDICRCIQQAFPNDSLYRIGGDEFLVLCIGIEKRNLNTCAAKLDDLVRQNQMNLSIGTSWDASGLQRVSFEDLLTQAENEMYAAKQLHYRTRQTAEHTDLRTHEPHGEWTEDTPHEEHYFVAMHFCDNEQDEISEAEQKVIDKLLVDNAGVGIISGYFDENYTIHYISGLSLSALEFEYYHDFIRQTKKQMINLFDRDTERELFEKVIASSHKEGYIISMVGKGWNNISMHVIGSVCEDKNGNKLWILSIRRMNELQLANQKQDNRDIILNTLDSTALFVITEREHKILYYNRRVAEVTPNIKLGMLCKDLWDDACEKGPVGSIGEKQIAKAINYNTVFGEIVEVTATRILWGGEIPAFLMRICPCQTQEGNSPVPSQPDYSIDPITSGYNRVGFTYYLQKLLDQGVDLRNYALLFLNISGFKAINGLYGSEAGDRLLRTIYTSFYNSFLTPQLGARKESDHFVFLVKQEHLDLKKLTSILDFKWNYEQHEIMVNCRCGIYFPREKSENIQEAINRARLAKNYIKDAYVKPYAIFDEFMEKDYVERTEVLSTYEDALANSEFQVYYQPVISLKTGKIASAEALARWISPTKGMIFPSVFIPTLEEYGYITKLDQYIINEVTQFLLTRHQEKAPIVPVSVNLSQMDFYDTGLLNKIKSTSRKSTLPKDSIRYEITETAYHALEDQKGNFFEVMRSMGKKIMLDDFGIGYSSFAMIQNFDFDVLKIDIAFVRQLEDNNKVRHIIKMIISMCHGLGIEVVAEGVETKEQLDFLKQEGCDYVQGYYFSTPLNQEQFENYLKTHL